MTYTPAKIARSALDLSEKLLLELAVGADEPGVIAARHGVDEFDLEKLLERADVKKAIEIRQSELTAKGEFFKLKARALAEELLAEVFRDALSTKDPKVRLDAMKFLAAAGGVDKPVESRQVGTGRQVNISINLGAAGVQNVQVSFDDLFPSEGPGSNQDLIAAEYEELEE